MIPLAGRRRGPWREGAVGLLLAAAFLAGWVCAGPARAETAQPEAAPKLADYDVSRLILGGDFTLTNHNGRRMGLAAFRRRAVLLFFGYTHCPDVCPVALAKMARIKHGLGALADRFQPLFITLDPERDTPARLKAYVSNFEAGAVALTGTPEEIRRVTGLYRVRFEKEEARSPSEYLVSHTAYLYLMDGTGKLVYVFPPDVEDALLTQAVHRTLGR